MVSKCANPDCSAPFRYLRSGKLFRMEIERPGDDSPSHEPERTAIRRNQFFWLCNECSSRFRLVFAKNGVSVQPLVRTKAAAAGS